MAGVNLLVPQGLRTADPSPVSQPKTSRQARRGGAVRVGWGWQGFGEEGELGGRAGLPEVIPVPRSGLATALSLKGPAQAWAVDCGSCPQCLTRARPRLDSPIPDQRAFRKAVWLWQSSTDEGLGAEKLHLKTDSGTSSCMQADIALHF